MSEEFQPTEEPQRPPKRRSSGPSLFWPVALIALGIYFLSVNLGYVEPTAWVVLARLWPLILIMMGLDLIVRQLPGVLGSALSLLLAVGLIGAIVYIVTNPDQYPGLTGGGAIPEPTTQRVSAELGGAERAAVMLDLETYRTHIDTDISDDMLIVADVTTPGQARLELDPEDDPVSVRLHTDLDEMAWLYWLNPKTWEGGEGPDWRIHLSPRPDTELEIDVGSGGVEADLRNLRLASLYVDEGDGSLRLTLPDRGGYDAELSGGSGSVTIELPLGVEARVDLDSGSGSFNPDERFRLVEGERRGDGIWETEGYREGDSNSVYIIIDQGDGSVTIVEP